MRNYDNMPVLEWQDGANVAKAKTQILRQEPVVLKMPPDFDWSLQTDEFECKRDDDSGILYDCLGGDLLRQLAERNELPGLTEIADACVQSSSRVDLDAEGSRIVVHD